MAGARDRAELRPRDAAARVRPPAPRAREEGGGARPRGDRRWRPLLRDGWVVGAETAPADVEAGAEPDEIHARFTIAADGAASRFAAHAGVRRDETRPLGIAARRYYRAPNLGGPWFESWLDLWEDDMLLPGYGWFFPMADGRVNLGRSAQHVPTLQGRLGHAVVRRVREDAPGGSRHLRGVRRRPDALRPAADELEPRPAGRPGDARRRRRRRRREPDERRGHRVRDRDRRARGGAGPRGAAEGPAGTRDVVPGRPPESTVGTSRSGAGSPASWASPRSWGRPRSTSCPTRR